VVLDNVDGAEGVALARWRRHPDGVDVDDVDDVDERRHFGVVLLVGGCLDGVLVDDGVVVEARDELLSDGLAVEGEPRYQAGTESRSMEARIRSW